MFDKFDITIGKLDGEQFETKFKFGRRLLRKMEKEVKLESGRSLEEKRELSRSQMVQLIRKLLQCTQFKESLLVEWGRVLPYLEDARKYAYAPAQKEEAVKLGSEEKFQQSIYQFPVFVDSGVINVFLDDKLEESGEEENMNCPPLTEPMNRKQVLKNIGTGMDRLVNLASQVQVEEIKSEKVHLFDKLTAELGEQLNWLQIHNKRELENLSALEKQISEDSRRQLSRYEADIADTQLKIADLQLQLKTINAKNETQDEIREEFDTLSWEEDSQELERRLEEQEMEKTTKIGKKNCFACRSDELVKQQCSLTLQCKPQKFKKEVKLSRKLTKNRKKTTKHCWKCGNKGHLKSECIRRR